MGRRQITQHTKKERLAAEAFITQLMRKGLDDRGTDGATDVTKMPVVLKEAEPSGVPGVQVKTSSMQDLSDVEGENPHCANR